MHEEKSETLTVSMLAKEYYHTTDHAMYHLRSKYPDAVPPPIRIPGVRRLLWLRKTVDEWFQARQEPASAMQLPPKIASRVTPPARTGAPTKTERVEAKRLGITVKELRARTAAGDFSSGSE